MQRVFAYVRACVYMCVKDATRGHPKSSSIYLRTSGLRKTSCEVWKELASVTAVMAGDSLGSAYKAKNEREREREREGSI